MINYVSLITNEKIDLETQMDKNERIFFDDVTKSVLNVEADKFYYIIRLGLCSYDLLNPFMTQDDKDIKEILAVLNKLVNQFEIALFIIEDDDTLYYMRDLQFMIDNALGIITTSLPNLIDQIRSIDKFVLYKIESESEYEIFNKSEILDEYKKLEINKYLSLFDVKNNQFICSILNLPEQLINNNKSINAIVDKTISLLYQGTPVEQIENQIYKSKEYLELKYSEVNSKKRIDLIKQKLSGAYDYNDSYYVELMLADNVARTIYKSFEKTIPELEDGKLINYIVEQCQKYKTNSPIVEEEIYLMTVLGYKISIIDLSCLLSIIGLLGELGCPLRSDYFINLLSEDSGRVFNPQISLIAERISGKKELIIKLVKYYFNDNADEIIPMVCK
ncbi:MAG: hypothetical protein A2Y23_05575 [Clostridiales bacterium GWB2_37_7]|nr:MAG: hypothetical protein A2Y23_05575 [Clostridiales bacterium GWB2_37_7]